VGLAGVKEWPLADYTHMNI